MTPGGLREDAVPAPQAAVAQPFKYGETTMYMHHNPAQQAVAAPAAKQSEVARKLAIIEKKDAAPAGAEEIAATARAMEGSRRAGEQATAAAGKRPWVSAGSYLPAACDSFRVH